MIKALNLEDCTAIGIGNHQSIIDNIIFIP